MKVSDLIKDYLSHNKAFFSQLKNKKSIHDRVDIDFSQLSDKIHNEYDPVFVLSTGRNGTMLLTKLFELSNQCLAVHEPEPELSMPSKLAYENYRNNPEFVKGMFEGARYEMLRTSFLMGKKFIETNNRITFFAFQISELYPNAKFIHLVRKPESFIKSGLSRKWYSGKTLYDEARIVHPDKKLWGTMNEYDKIAWLWNETNLFIEEFKMKYPEKIITIKAEELFINKSVSLEMMNFCGINDINHKNISKTIAVKTNAGKAVNVDENLITKAIDRFANKKQLYYP